MSTIKNIIIFLVIGAVFALIYFYFVREDPNTANLVSSSPDADLLDTGGLTAEENSVIAQEFLSLLLNVRQITLDNAIFSDNAFISLTDSSIVLIPDGNEGRVNPFAPFGSDVANAFPLTCVLPEVLNTLTNVCVSPPPTN